MINGIFKCECGEVFPGETQFNQHQENCDHAKVARWESVLTQITSPECKCCCCGHTLTHDQVLYETGPYYNQMIYRPEENHGYQYVCAACADLMYPNEQERLMWPHEVQEYLRLRQTSVPYPWLKEYRTNLFRELQEYLYHPARVQQWLDSGYSIETYMTSHQTDKRD
ncbi:hypothetical protein PHMEG_00035091 [Phytophthora megakarya]|uniref:Uncharacterized protein n=1 Tax=Phytophthora megakarya TaxID=4795 RepID=A0A225UPI3_9STRA|nr:hypothetical protein PHMEG_00035091 [Phytophthora megakarya]